MVLGAGFDTSAYRSPHADLRFWEVDFPATGQWKRERLAEAGIAVPETVSHVGVDFERDSLLERLTEAGLDSGAPAFFLWLGVVPYLTRAATEATLRAIGSVPGGEVVLDLPAPADQVAARARADRADLEATVARLGEPFRGGWQPAELLALLAGRRLRRRRGPRPVRDPDPLPRAPAQPRAGRRPRDPRAPHHLTPTAPGRRDRSRHGRR